MGMAEKLMQRLVWKGNIGLGYSRIRQFGYRGCLVEAIWKSGVQGFERGKPFASQSSPEDLSRLQVKVKSETVELGDRRQVSKDLLWDSRGKAWGWVRPWALQVGG